MATKKRPPSAPSAPGAPASGAPPTPWAELLAYAAPQLPDTQQPEGIAALQEALGERDEAAPAQLLAWATGAPLPRAVGPPAPLLWLAMLERLLRRALTRAPFSATKAQLQPLATVLARRDPDTLRPLVGPALRVVIGMSRDDDVPQLRAWLTHFLKETSMATTFFIDDSSIPILQQNGAKEALIKRVSDELRDRFGMPADSIDPTKAPRAAAILGMVVLDGEVDAKSSGLPDALRRAWLEAIGDIPNNAVPPEKVPLSTVFQFIADTLPRLKGGANAIAVQEFAFVGRELIGGANSIPFGHPNFESALRIALDKYVQTRATGDSLTLPPGSLPGGTQNAGGDADLNSDTIRVTGLSYSLALLERTLVFKVADRVTELFMNGLLPFGHDAGGKAIDDYYWDAEDRLTESQRRSHYSRTLGMPGGEVSKEVAPNAAFEQLFLRFIASVREFTRQREVDRMFTNRASQLSMTGEQVRKCAFETAKNASLYGWGGGFFTFTRINRHLQRAIDILSLPQVLKTFTASNHWQVIERVAQEHYGGAPNWAKYSTMAQAASTLFTILANNTAALAATNSGRPFLFDPSFGDGGDGDLSRETTDLLLRSVQQWLAVNGVREDQVMQYAQPVELTTAPSLPGSGVMRPESGVDVVNKLKQLVAGGTPNPDEVQKLLASLS